MINRMTIRPARVNAVYVCFGSMDKLWHSKPGEVLCHTEGLQAHSISESSFTEETHLQSI